MNAVSRTEAETIESVVNALWNGAQLTVSVRFEGQELPTRDVHIRRAKMRELSQVIAFFSEIVARVPPQTVEDVITMVAGLQRKAIEEGKSPQDIQMTPQTLIEKWKGEAGLIMQVMGGTVDLLPRFVSIFTDLSAEDADTLEIDDALLVIIGILGANYGFFTQRLLPIMKAVIADSRRKRDV